MGNLQKLIDEMHRGNQQLILDNIASKNKIVILNAIMAGTKLGMTEPEFRAGVWAATEDHTTLLNIPLSSFATAALHILGEKLYTGTDPMIRNMIQAGFS